MTDTPDTPVTSEEDEVEWREAPDDVSDLLNFDFGTAGAVDRSGLRALINSALVAHRRLPMLEVIFDRTARLMTTSLRQLTDDNIEAALDDVATSRFGDFLASVALPAVVGVVRMAPLSDYCLLAADAALVYSIVDLLLGGRRGADPLYFEERSLTAIELGLARRILALLAEDLGEAFGPAANGPFTLDRIETTPRFAAIAQEASVCALAKFRIRIEGAGGRASILIPHAALEPIRKILMREFIGEAPGADRAWREHLENGVAASTIEIAAVLAEKSASIRSLKTLSRGDTLVFHGPTGTAEIRAGGKAVGRGRVGRAGEVVAVKLIGGAASRSLDEEAA